MANRIFSNFVRGQLTEACIWFFLVYIGLSILRLPYAILISSIVALCSLIPVSYTHLDVYKRQVQNKSLDETLTREIAIAMVMGVIMIAVILCLTTTSWFEPFLFLFIMGVAIIINMGTNIFLGEISFLTFSTAAILQLAIAMDYSVFLLHSFTRERHAGIEPCLLYTSRTLSANGLIVI